MSNVKQAFEEITGRRRWRRFPKSVPLASAPIERCAALAGGVDRLAELIGVSPQTLRNRRASHGGRFAADQEALVERAFALEGWVLPAGFVTEEGVFATPGRATPDEALDQLEKRKAA